MKTPYGKPISSFSLLASSLCLLSSELQPSPSALGASCSESHHRHSYHHHWGVSLPLPPWPGQLPGQRERSYENCRKIKHLHTKYWCHYWTVAELFANFQWLILGWSNSIFQQTELLRTNSENSEQLSCSMCMIEWSPKVTFSRSVSPHLRVDT